MEDQYYNVMRWAGRGVGFQEMCKWPEVKFPVTCETQLLLFVMLQSQVMGERPSICTFLSALEISGPCSQSECCRSSPAISQVTPLGLLFRFVRKILGFSCKILLNPASKTVMASYANAPVAVIP